jgi:hypothetical protein
VIQRVPFTGREKERLHASLNRHRDAVQWKVVGLDEEQLRRPMVPSGTNLIGLLKHPDETSADIVAYYGRSRAAADVVIDEVGLEDVGTAWSGQTVSMRWVLIHMIEDTARHSGHMDILRELIDVQTGDHRPD